MYQDLFNLFCGVNLKRRRKIAHPVCGLGFGSLRTLWVYVHFSGVTINDLFVYRTPVLFKLIRNCSFDAGLIGMGKI